MLKIKDNITYDMLKKYGFEESDIIPNYYYVRGSIRIKDRIVNVPSSNKATINLLYDLISNDYFEKIPDISRKKLTKDQTTIITARDYILNHQLVDTGKYEVDGKILLDILKID